MTALARILSPCHDVVVVQVDGMVVASDAGGQFVMFPCPGCKSENRVQPVTMARVATPLADFYVRIGAVDVRGLGDAAPRHQNVPCAVTPAAPVMGRRPSHPVPPQAAEPALDREFSDPARGFTNRITEDEFFGFVTQMEQTDDPAAFAARAKRTLP